MRNKILVAIVVFFIVTTQGCSFKRGVGYVNDALTIRDWYGDIGVEMSIVASVDNRYDDYETVYPGYYRKSEYGMTDVPVELSMGILYSVFKNEHVRINAGVKYSNYFRIAYYYYYSYTEYDYSREYYYRDELTVSYFTENKIGFIFPDIEINTPFIDNLKFVFSFELFHLNLYFANGYYRDKFEQRLNNYGYSELFDSTACFPEFDKIVIGTSGFDLGSIKIGLLYYFD